MGSGGTAKMRSTGWPPCTGSEGTTIAFVPAGSGRTTSTRPPGKSISSSFGKIARRKIVSLPASALELLPASWPTDEACPQPGMLAVIGNVPTAARQARILVDGCHFSGLV
jgi:hypothetical protein